MLILLSFFWKKLNTKGVSLHTSITTRKKYSQIQKLHAQNPLDKIMEKTCYIIHVLYRLKCPSTLCRGWWECNLCNIYTFASERGPKWVSWTLKDNYMSHKWHIILETKITSNVWNRRRIRHDYALIWFCDEGGIEPLVQW